MFIKSRPTVQLLLPRELVPGQDVSAMVVLQCKKPIDVDEVALGITGTEYWPEQLRKFLTLQASLGAYELSAGEHRLPFRFKVPDYAPASFQGKIASIRYEANVHVDVPWWPDRRSSFMLHVAAPPVEAPTDSPKRYSSNPKGPLSTEAHAELSLATDWARPGDHISGAFALFNTEFNDYDGATVGLHSTERAHFGFKQHMPGRVYLSRFDDTARGEGSMAAFRLRVPMEAAPGFTAMRDNTQGLFSYEWEFQLEVNVRGGKNLTMRVPFRILPHDPSANPRPYQAPPVVGTNRIGDVWKEVGIEHSFEFDGSVLTARHGKAKVEVRRAHKGKVGVFLEAEVGFPSLGLDLRLERASGMRRVIGGGVLFDDPEVDPYLFVEARDADQTRDSLKWALIDDISALAKDSATLIHMNDDSCLFQLEDDASNTDALEQMLVFARGAVQKLDEMAQAVHPPSGCKETVPEWERVAKRLGGKLQMGALCVEADQGSTYVEVRTDFDGHGNASGTTIEVRPHSDVEADIFECRASSEDVRETIDATYKGEVRELVVAALSGATYFRLEPAVLVLQFNALLGHPPKDSTGMLEDARKMDAAIIMQRVSHLVRIVALLRGESGPYR